jgi:two-component system sensor histidine kinase/response regulator
VLRPILNIEMAGMPVLIVDDNHTNIEVLSGMLVRKSILVTACSSGQKRLDLLEQRSLEIGHCPFKVAILDMQMPYMDGAELAKRSVIMPTMTV